MLDDGFGGDRGLGGRAQSFWCLGQWRLVLVGLAKGVQSTGSQRGRRTMLRQTSSLDSVEKERQHGKW